MTRESRDKRVMGKSALSGWCLDLEPAGILELFDLLIRGLQ